MSEPFIPSVFTVSREGGAGLTRSVTRGREFVAPSRGVRIRLQDAHAADVRQRAALLGCSRDAVLVDVSAARAWGLPVPPWMTVERRADVVAVPRGRARPRRADVTGRRVELVHWARGRRGVRSARLALPLLDPRAESPGESLTRVMLLRGGLPSPVLNLDVLEDGEWLARVDLAWPGERVIVEYDGAVHLDERQRRRDARRRNLLQDAGWTVIVLTADDLRHHWPLAKGGWAPLTR